MKCWLDWQLFCWVWLRDWEIDDPQEKCCLKIFQNTHFLIHIFKKERKSVLTLISETLIIPDLQIFMISPESQKSDILHNTHFLIHI